MLPEITEKHIRNVAFPVFKLDSDELTYYKDKLYCQGKVVDDRLAPGKSLGVRRLYVKEPLYPLTHMAPDFITMIQARYRHFIDSKGRPFSYKKTKYCKVKSHKIKEIIYRDTFSVVKLKGIKTTFNVRRPPPAGCTWAGVIYSGDFPWEILEFSEEAQPTYKRKI